MKLSTMLIGAATLVGIGVYVGKKLIKSDEHPDESVVIAENKETYSDKFHKASMFAVGAVKTSADKIAEGIKEIKSADMVKKGEETIEQAKETTEQIKKDLEDLKNMVVSINVSVENGENKIEDEELQNNDDIMPKEEDYMETGPSSDIDDLK